MIHIVVPCVQPFPSIGVPIRCGRSSGNFGWAIRVIAIEIDAVCISPLGVLFIVSLLILDYKTIILSKEIKHINQNLDQLKLNVAPCFILK